MGHRNSAFVESLVHRLGPRLLASAATMPPKKEVPVEKPVLGRCSSHLKIGACLTLPRVLSLPPSIHGLTVLALRRHLRHA